MNTFRRLVAGLDTVECAYFLEAGAGCALDFGALGVEKERLRQAKSRDPIKITLAGMDVLLHPYGSSSGYPFVISNGDYTISCGEFNNPSFFVKFRSAALWHRGAEALHREFLNWGERLGFRAFREESLARVDFAFDYQLQEVDFDADSFISLSAKDSQHRKDGQPQTFTYGKGDIVLRMHDKVAEIAEESGKTWMYDLWGEKEDV